MQWKKASEILPSASDRYLVTDGKEIEIMTYFGTFKGSPEWSSYNCNTLDVTHWMVLPSLPQFNFGPNPGD